MLKKPLMFLLIALLTMGMLFVWSCGDGGIFEPGGNGSDFDESGQKQGPDGEGSGTEESVLLENIDLNIMCVGDLMIHSSQIASQYDKSTGLYNYDNNFEYIKPYIQEADLALCNVETTFSGGTPTGYPSFNAPDSLAGTLADTGFNVGLTSNNHMHDKRLAGMKRTLRILRSQGLATSGSRLPWERNFALMHVKGIKVAIVSFTYETHKYEGKRTINGVVLSPEAAELVNSYDYDFLDQDLKRVEATIKEARKAGADIVIVYHHWGEEYQRRANPWQKRIAEATVKMGADIIFGSHAHVVQEIEYLTNEETGKKVPVYYCMGNIISNQRAETLNNRYTEQGMIARVKLTFDPNIGEIKDIKADAMITWVDKYKSGGKDVYAIIPLDTELEDNPTLKASGHLNRARQAAEDAESVIGSEYIWK